MVWLYFNNIFWISILICFILKLVCSFSPCLNGGSCISNSTNFVCSCVDSYYGKYCQSKQLNSTIFSSSTILTQETSVQLAKLIEIPSNKSYKLLYQSSKDGFKANDFHTKVGGKSNTLTIIKTKSGNIFGGYLSSSWSNYGYSVFDDTAFIFSLINSYNIPVKINVTKSKSAVYSYYFYGPTFGNGFDIYIPDNFDTSSGYSNLGNSYAIPNFATGSSNSFLAGSYYFTVSEIEVYQLDGIINKF